jgi:hypothetical protein
MAHHRTPVDGDETFEAGADLSANQFFILEEATTGKVTVCNASTDRPQGILMNKPKLGEAARVRRDGLAKVISDGSGTAILIGDQVGTDGNGRAVKKTTDKDWVIGTAQSASAILGGVITVEVNIRQLSQ